MRKKAEMVIRSLFSAFRDLDENLQKALHKYLEVRGIKSSLFDFLHEYMLQKDEREYLAWLQNIKKFVAM